MQSGIELPIGHSSSGIPIFGTIAPLRDVTGKIVASGIESWGRALLLWSALLEWIGGVGILLLLVAVLPSISRSGRSLYDAEEGGFKRDSILPKLRDSAKNIWKVYSVCTVLGILSILAFVPEATWFDAVTIISSTISTAGFSIKNCNIAEYHSATLKWIIVIFMVVGSLNFALYFHALKRHWRQWINKELMALLGSFFLGGGIVAFAIYGTSYQDLSGIAGTYSLSRAITSGYFHYISSQSTTGFAVDNYDTWPSLAMGTMIGGMFIGGMTGSSTGGIKVGRIFTLLAWVKNELLKVISLQHKAPQIGFVQADGQLRLEQAAAFLPLMILVIFAATLLLCADHLDLYTAFTTAASMANNVGLGYGLVGPTESFAVLSIASKLLCIVLMVAGRLEYFVVFAICLPFFWEE